MYGNDDQICQKKSLVTISATFGGDWLICFFEDHFDFESRLTSIGVGKTSLIQRAETGEFKIYTPTVGGSVPSEKVVIGQNVLWFWDTGGSLCKYNNDLQ
jgi:hypothetical protein